RHFVADEPPPALVERLAKRFLATQGDLKETARALVAAPEAWEAPRAKLKRPGEWVIAALRAVSAAPAEIGPVMQAHNLLGEPLTNLHAATRRELLIASGTLFAWAYLPKLARAEGRDPRLLVIVLRGALDGLAAVAPVGDPDWLALRGNSALTLDGKPAALPLDSFFALNPA